MGNTTSERVSGERHGSKSHRSDGSGAAHPTKEHPHKIMVGSTDDPSVFSSHDSKVGAGCSLPCLPSGASTHLLCGAVFPAVPRGVSGELGGWRSSVVLLCVMCRWSVQARCRGQLCECVNSCLCVSVTSLWFSLPRFLGTRILCHGSQIWRSQ